jgi:hypothetical protein
VVNGRDDWTTGPIAAHRLTSAGARPMGELTDGMAE